MRLGLPGLWPRLVYVGPLSPLEFAGGTRQRKEEADSRRNDRKKGKGQEREGSRFLTPLGMTISLEIVKEKQGQRRGALRCVATSFFPLSISFFLLPTSCFVTPGGGA